MDRRKFIEILPIMPFAFKRAFSDQPDKENPTKKTVSLTKEEIKFFGKFEYPDPKDVPELLKGYMKNFSSWPEVVLDQKNRAIYQVQSERYNSLVKAHYDDFKNIDTHSKNSEEIEKLVAQLIKDRVSNIQSTVVHFKSLKKLVFGNFGIINQTSTMNLDTTQLIPIEYEESYGSGEEQTFTKNKIPKIAIDIAFHEYVHATEIPDLMHLQVIRKIVEILIDTRKDLDINSQEHVSAKALDSFYQRIKVAENLRADTEPNKMPDRVDSSDFPSELIARLQTIRFNLHLVCEFNEEVLQFDMNKDDFTEEHLDFLIKNEEQIFQVEYAEDLSNPEYLNNDTVPKNPTSDLSFFTKSLGKQNFIFLINYAV